MVEVIYPVISETFLNKSILSKNTTNEYGQYILAVSSIDPRKNFKSLIKAFKNCHLSSINLLIVGNANKLFAADKELSEVVEDDPSIIFTGYVDDEELVALYRNAKVFAYPSFFEGFGLPPLEAMACGCATVVANTTSLPEVCGDASIYVDPYNIDSIKEGLLRGLNDYVKREEIIQLGHQRVARYNIDESVDKMIVLLNSMI